MALVQLKLTIDQQVVLIQFVFSID